MGGIITTLVITRSYSNILDAVHVLIFATLLFQIRLNYFSNNDIQKLTVNPFSSNRSLQGLTWFADFQSSVNNVYPLLSQCGEMDPCVYHWCRIKGWLKYCLFTFLYPNLP